MLYTFQSHVPSIQYSTVSSSWQQHETLDPSSRLSEPNELGSGTDANTYVPPHSFEVQVPAGNSQSAAQPYLSSSNLPPQDESTVNPSSQYLLSSYGLPTPNLDMYYDPHLNTDPKAFSQMNKRALDGYLDRVPPSPSPSLPATDIQLRLDPAYLYSSPDMYWYAMPSHTDFPPPPPPSSSRFP
ncbi:uncharacterized protein VTP21DRAFT_55 [Calcarisporiella thermophila]|uniref:uncharacterized protein n=1 Tax=Calcarisporiella thermophila TaxID=911321 RepID=UPI003743ACE5